MALLAALTTFFLLLHCTLAAPPANFRGTETSYRVIPTGTVSSDNLFGTWLYKYTDCEKNFGEGARSKIDEAYYDAWLISNTPGVASHIDWNNMAALDFLGPPGLNRAQRSQIQAVFANTATVIYGLNNRFQHHINIRCDDPKKRCQSRPDHPPKQAPLAYALNSDPDESGTPMINFCSGFFARRSLADAITYGNALAMPDFANLASYDNRAHTFLHNLYHLDLAADSPEPNPRVEDLQLDIRVYNSTWTTMAYGPLYCKVLARWIGAGTGEGSVGYWVQRNADNLAYYALAKYLMSKMDGDYLHLPIVVHHELDRPPCPSYPGSLATFVTEGSNFYLNTTDDLTIWDSSSGGGYPGCSDYANGSEISSPLAIDGFAPASAYPDHYHRQVSAWIEALGSTDRGSNPVSGEDASQGKKILDYGRTGYLGVSQQHLQLD